MRKTSLSVLMASCLVTGHFGTETRLKASATPAALSGCISGYIHTVSAEWEERGKPTTGSVRTLFHASLVVTQFNSLWAAFASLHIWKSSLTSETRHSV